jgi:hypothetical protein
MPGGQLEKMKIYAYNNAEMSDSQQVGQPFVALVNPETYSLDFKVEFNFKQGHGTSGANPKFERKLPDELSFEFLFDNTGILDGNPTADVAQKVQDFGTFMTGFDSDSHEPLFFKLVWGILIFSGRCTGVNMAFKLFNPDGKPIRAVCKITLKQFKEDNLRAAQEDAHSPDLTHHRTIKKGDTLPMLCYLVYGDSRHYLEVARANGIVNFRNLVVGDRIFFPPFDKSSGALAPASARAA